MQKLAKWGQKSGDEKNVILNKFFLKYKNQKNKNLDFKNKLLPKLFFFFNIFVPIF
jgi:hypothetical protein